MAVIFWVLWLFPPGCLVFSLKTRISKFTGIMLLISGIGYTLDSTFLFLYPRMKVPSLLDFTPYGEILFMIRVLVKSKNIGELTEKTTQSQK